MQVINLPSGQADVLKVSGEIDSHFSPRLLAVLRVKLHEHHPLLFLDCSELDYIGSRGMAALVEYVRDANKFGGRLAIIGLKPKLRGLFEIVGLDKHLLLYEDISEARLTDSRLAA